MVEIKDPDECSAGAKPGLSDLQTPAKPALWPHSVITLLYVPSDPQVRSEMGKQISYALYRKFLDSLPAEDRDKVEANRDWIKRISALRGKYDLFLIREAKLLGWRLLL